MNAEPQFPKTPAACADFLRNYNQWRRGDANITQPDPTQIGPALTMAAELIDTQPSEGPFTDQQKNMILRDMVNVFQEQFDQIDTLLGLPVNDCTPSDINRTLAAIDRLKQQIHWLMASRPHVAEKQAEIEKLREELSKRQFAQSGDVFQLTERILADCGCSTNHHTLVDKAQGRIFSFVEDELTAAQAEIDKLTEQLKTQKEYYESVIQDGGEQIEKLREESNARAMLYGQQTSELMRAQSRIAELEAENAELVEALRHDRVSLQAEAKHPAPCKKFCEATAFRHDQRDLKRRIAELEQPRPWPTMGYGQVAIGGGMQPDGNSALLYMDMGEVRDIDADTTDIFPIGTSADPSKLLACIYFKDSAAIQQTIDVLKEMQLEFAAKGSPA